VVDGYFARHRVKPGVTAGRRSTVGAARSTRGENRRRTNTDLDYIETGRWLFDVKILD